MKLTISIRIRIVIISNNKSKNNKNTKTNRKRSVEYKEGNIINPNGCRAKNVTPKYHALRCRPRVSSACFPWDTDYLINYITLVISYPTVTHREADRW